MEEKSKKKKKIFNILNVMVSVLFGVLIFAQVIIWIISFFNDNTTLNIFGYKPYVALYDEDVLNFNEYDLVVGKQLEDYKDYIYNSEIIYKQHYKNNGQAVILKSENFNIVERNSKSRIEGKIKFVINKIGKIILFFREVYVVIISAIVLSVICILVYLMRTNKNHINDDKDQNDELYKKYIKNRRIKDISIILFIIVTYISIFMIGKLNKNIGTNAIVLDANNEKDNYINNNINNINNENNANNEVTQNDVNEGEIVFLVTENDISWKQIKNLGIFKNNYFGGENKIAPGISGNYEFKVENKCEYNMKYILRFEVQNESFVNLKYKIKRNGQYLNDDYQYIEEIKLQENVIKYFGTDVYTIEWKWVDSENDTQIGENAENVKYNLKIAVTAEKE
ncbi:MAG: hypothetical protein J6K42_01145 [Clostridia bacterium]|nr:hypothetical protein [Clostridia bacterium]